MYGALREAISDRDAGAVVHVGDRFDDDLRYLTRFLGPDRAYAVVVTPETAVCCAPRLFGDDARAAFPGEVRTENAALPAGRRAAAVLDDHDVAGTVLTPQSIPHDAALYLEGAGYELASTDAVAAARAVKTDREVDRLRAVAGAAEAGIRRGAAVLRAATVDGDDLRWDGDPLTTECLRRAVDATMAGAGVDPARNTVCGSGPSCADLHYRGEDPIRPGETVLLDVSPRGPEGYYADCTRTFVVDGDGGWPRRAHVACEMGAEAAFAVLSAGAGERASTVHTEAAAEIRAYGFPVDDGPVGFTHSVGHGVGLSLHERPSLRGDADLRAGHVLTVEPGVYDPERGGVRVEDSVVVREDGYDSLTDLPRSLDPGAYDPP